MEANTELLSAAESIFKPACLSFLKTWLDTATKDELKGLKIIQAVIKHKGKKRFKKHTKTERIDFETAAVDMRRRTMQSYYNTQYSSVSPEKYHVSDILKFRKLSEQKYSQVLKESALQVINQWIALGDDPSFVDSLVLCLQGIHAVVKINENLPVTSNQDNFYWFTKEERSRANVPSSNFSATAPNFHPKKKSSSVVTDEMNSTPLRSFFEPSFYQERMVRKMRGSGDFINWVYDQNSSVYQNSFASKVNKNPNKVAKPANSSTVVRVLPLNSVKR